MSVPPEELTKNNMLTGWGKSSVSELSDMTSNQTSKHVASFNDSSLFTDS